MGIWWPDGDLHSNPGGGRTVEKGMRMFPLTPRFISYPVFKINSHLRTKEGIVFNIQALNAVQSLRMFEASLCTI